MRWRRTPASRSASSANGKQRNTPFPAIVAFLSRRHPPPPPNPLRVALHASLATPTRRGWPSRTTGGWTIKASWWSLIRGQRISSRWRQETCSISTWGAVCSSCFLQVLETSCAGGGVLCGGHESLFCRKRTTCEQDTCVACGQNVFFVC